MFPGSQFYGIKKIFLNYAKLPTWLPFPVAVEHGWQRVAHDFEASSNPPEIWVWSPRIAKELEKFYPKSKIKVVGSFFCYFMRLNQAKTNSVEIKGSICIPPHSSHLAKSKYSIEKFAEKLNELDDHFKPIRVMLYYLDMNQETINMFKKYGFDIVSNGTLYDSDFLSNFLRHVTDKKYCIFSELGSGVIFSRYLGLIPQHIEIDSEVENFGNQYLTEEYISESNKFDNNFLLDMSICRVKDEVGESYILSPKDLRKLILKNYFTYNFIKIFVRRSLRYILGCVGVSKKMFVN